MQDKRIPDNSITSSSELSANHAPAFARLDGPRAWCSAPGDKSPYIQITWDEENLITAITTQGSSRDSSWARNFEVTYTRDEKWTSYGKVTFSESYQWCFYQHYKVTVDVTNKTTFFFIMTTLSLPFTLKGTKRKQMAKRCDNHQHGVDACGLDFWHLVGSFRNITTFFTYILYSVPVEPKLLLRLNTQTQNWENIATTVSLANIWWHITNTFIITSFITIKNKAP